MNPTFRQTLILLVFYSVCYVFWAWLLGPGFKSYKLLDFSHFLNPEWLANNMLGSLIALHSQPPLMNIIIGIIFKISPEHYAGIFRALYFCAGAGGVIALYRTLVVLGISARIRMIVWGILCASPTFYMFGSWFGSTHLEFCITAYLVYALTCYCLQPEKRLIHLAAIFICFALLGLIRPQWHLILFIALGMVLIWAGGRTLYKPALLLSLIFILPIGGWYTKNFFVFGFWGGSSWMGINVAQVAFKASKYDLRRMRHEGSIAEDFPADFSLPKIMARIPPDNFDLLSPVLGPMKSQDPDFLKYAAANEMQHYVPYNLNYLGIIPSARQDMRDAMTIIGTHPLDYVKMVSRQFIRIAMIPSFAATSLNMIKIYPYADKLISLPLLNFTLINLGAMSLYLLMPVAVVLNDLRHKKSSKRLLLMIILAFVGFMTVTSCAFNGYEQERMRWGWQPIYVVFAAIFLENARKWWDSKRHGRTAEHPQPER